MDLAEATAFQETLDQLFHNINNNSNNNSIQQNINNKKDKSDVAEKALLILLTNVHVDGIFFHRREKFVKN